MKIRLPKELMDHQARNTREEDCMDFVSAPVFPTRRKEGERAAEIRSNEEDLVSA